MTASDPRQTSEGHVLAHWRGTAPTAATMLGGPLAGLAGNFLARHLGVPADSPNAQKDVKELVLGQSPEALAHVRQAEIELQKHLADNGIDLERIAAADRANARAREISVRDDTPRQLAWLLIGGFIAVSAAQLVAIMGWPQKIASISPQGWLLIGNISGYLAFEAKQAAAYYFGSSIGSKDKDATLQEIARQP